MGDPIDDELEDHDDDRYDADLTLIMNAGIYMIELAVVHDIQFKELNLCIH